MEGGASPSGIPGERLSPIYPGVKEWLFCPGMLFQAKQTWWGGRGPRPRPHEGVDLVVYADREDRICCLTETTQALALSDGLVVKIIPDFLGKSVILEHAVRKGPMGWLYFIYAHTRPMEGIEPGRFVKRGDPIATVAVPNRSSFPMVPHLHFSVAGSSRSVPSDCFDWDRIGVSRAFTLLDPLEVAGFPHRLLGNEAPPCQAL